MNGRAKLPTNGRAGPANSTPSEDRGLWRWALLLALATVGHRAVLAANQFILVTDTGTLGLMALNILDGERPLFLYGFSYSGAPLAYLIALFFRLFGVSLFTLALPVALLAGLWVWLSYLLFRRIAGPRAGLAVAILFACPDRLTAWYTHTPDTSYGGFLMLATWILWLAVEMEARDLRGFRLAAWMAMLGAAGGLAFWTNALIAPYLLVAAVPVVILLWRHRFHPSRLAACLPAALFFLLAASPVRHMTERISQGTTLAWNLNPKWIFDNYRALVTETLPSFFEWTTEGDGLTRLAGWCFVAAGLATGLWTWTRPWRFPSRWRATLPLLLMAVSLAGYLPHVMAHANVPRYLLPFWTMFLAFAIATPMGSASPRLRTATSMLLAVWLVWNVNGSWAVMRLGRLDRDLRLKRRAAITAAVERLGARHATLLGDYYFQSEANGMSFLARQRVKFAATGQERHLPTAQVVEREPIRIYICQQALLPAARASLHALGSRWRETPVDDTVTLLHDLQPQRQARRAIPAPSILKSFEPEGGREKATRLLDSNFRTSLVGGRTHRESFTLDLGSERAICGLDLLPADSEGLQLPTHGEAAVSRDGTNYVTVVPWEARIPIAYAAGESIYLGGGQGRITFSFPPVIARYVRFTGASPRGSPLDFPPAGVAGRPLPGLAAGWMVAEARVFEVTHERASTTGRALPELTDYLADMGVRFTVCDRWLSARLLAGQPAGAAPCAYPLFEKPGHLQGDGGVQDFWRFTPATNTAVIVARELADAQAAFLRQALGQASPWLLSEHGDYISFVFLPSLPNHPPSLTWDGAMLTW